VRPNSQSHFRQSLKALHDSEESRLSHPVIQEDFDNADVAEERDRGANLGEDGGRRPSSELEAGEEQFEVAGGACAGRGGVAD